MDKESYLDLVKEKIEHDKLIASINPKYREELEILLNKKKEIFKKNTLFADYQLKKINQKIEKIKNKS